MPPLWQRAQAAYSVADAATMSFEVFLLSLHPPKDSVARTLKDLAALGIHVKLITGDNRHVAAHVAGALGLAIDTLKYIGITTSANFGNMVSMAIGSLYLPFLPLAAK